MIPFAHWKLYFLPTVTNKSIWCLSIRLQNGPWSDRNYLFCCQQLAVGLWSWSHQFSAYPGRKNHICRCSLFNIPWEWKGGVSCDRTLPSGCVIDWWADYFNLVSRHYSLDVVVLFCDVLCAACRQQVIPMFYHDVHTLVKYIFLEASGITFIDAFMGDSCYLLCSFMLLDINNVLIAILIVFLFGKCVCWSHLC